MSDNSSASINRFAAILHAPWVKGVGTGEIIHTWAEDSTDTKLTVPPQLRDDIIGMQNWLHEKYKAFHAHLKKANRITSFFDS